MVEKRKLKIMESKNSLYKFMQVFDATDFAKEIFGKDIVKKAYGIHQKFDNKEDSIDTSKKFILINSKTKKSLFDEPILIYFSNGNIVKFEFSEWGAISRVKVPT